MLQNSFVPIIDRVKEILLKSAHDVEKIRQIKMLLSVPLNEEVVKEEEDDNPILTAQKPTDDHNETKTPSA